MIPVATICSIVFALCFQNVFDSVVKSDINMLKIAAAVCIVFAVLDCSCMMIIRFLKENLSKLFEKNYLKCN